MNAKVDYIGTITEIVQGGGELNGKNVHLEFAVDNGQVINVWGGTFDNGDQVDDLAFDEGGEFEGLNVELIKQANKIHQENKRLKS